MKKQDNGVGVLSSDKGEVTTEVCVQTQGTIQGVEENTPWMYTSRKRADGTMIGEGKGVTTTKDGDVINLIGSGAAQATPPGEVGHSLLWGSLFILHLVEVGEVERCGRCP